ncbi:uncharacterized protein K460DRAFT_428660 [Cucurbitaria berberidis CBS 394.84]|uniref:Uncharacterized protein n=1 Tax=Cucurbitaria berberidis CBS 394.84 TaxID=1168544 RepID=A0A9P4GP18_9PLEO|nr:uncharacterized protein K460DRAFT_428660 [Cucurbitaria berberidis CBS 394.84]KAF1849197.1 hypothetical protein K460DRAFT_428660 [Cucurbitaria berberidis CBS 394.84]
MPGLRLQHQLLGFLLLVNMALAGRFSFSIQEIIVGVTRDFKEDDLVLAIAATTGSTPSNNTWSLGSVEANDIIKWNNLTHEIEVPVSASNLSVAIGIMNTPNGTEVTVQNATSQLVQIIVGAAANMSGTAGPAERLLDIALNFFSDLTSCAGPTVIDNVTYAPDTLNSLNQSQKTCETKTYFEEVKILCGLQNSNYTVTYCLERLDAKPVPASAAASLLPGLFLLFITLAVACISGGYGLLM